MARVDGKSVPISAAQQFGAVAYLRWRLFVNSFRRKGGVGEVVARVIVYPIGVLFVVGPSLGAGFGSWAAVDAGKLNVLGAIFWGITLLQFFVSINLSQPGLSFDPESLIRFPVTFSRYLVVRLFLGLLSAANIIGTCALLAAAAGATVAKPSLGGIAFAAAISLAVTNTLFLRMIFAWIDRWLSTRRARELFTGFVILFSIGIQYLNVTFNTGFNRKDPAAQRRKLHAAMHFYHSSQAVLWHFPAGLAGLSIVNVANGATAYAAANLVAVWMFAALFLAVFAWRMQREYRGESLSDSGSLGIPVVQPSSVRAAVLPAAGANATLSDVSLSDRASATAAGGLRIPDGFSASFFKEWIYVRRNTAQLYGMLGPIAMVFLFAGKMGSRYMGSSWIFPACLAYSMLGVAAVSYNSFGLDGEGIQFYFLAPVRMQTVMLAKNLFAFAVAAVEGVIVYVVLCFVATRPSLLTTISTLLWLVFAVLVNVTVGNIRSIVSPKKMDPSKLTRRQASQLSGLMSVGLILVVAAVGYGVLVLADSAGIPWLPIPVFLLFAAGGIGLYVWGLGRLDGLVSRNRETMIEELCKAT